jgi:hypothetical protein
MPPPIVFYDGVCGFCKRAVQFILRRDPNAIFRFAALQSHFAAEILTRQLRRAPDAHREDLVVPTPIPGQPVDVNRGVYSSATVELRGNAPWQM